MSKPFNFEEFKAGKPAKLRNTVYHFIGYDEYLHNPLVVRYGKFLDKFTLEYFENEATMLPTKRTVWIAICEYISSKYKWSYSAFFNSKDDAMKLDGGDCWKVINAIPYEIEE